ncbi:WhiB family transcriptional regulator [Thermomonospora umbrina]|uniref:Transcriptional regulator WhiB n=1 Tax=Thermomonospora umbrina TaxID=111806 RepID=A0A3D9SHI8_9ACTN|nr:WhiB family transcriptional regulator [Thermomonospora umbrina]REE95157.1 transcription factor WhiB [Thermomonospora umbrina]
MTLVTPAPWHERAACRQADPEMFFARPADRPAIEAAKRVCSGCPVREECLRYASEHDDLEGIWGGTTERERLAARIRHRLAHSLTAV